MGINDLTTKVLQTQLNWSDGASEEITYLHKKTNSTEVVKCFPQSQTEEDTTKDNLEDEMTFHSVFLTVKPFKNDVITYDNIDWKVEKIKKVVNGCYDIVAYNKVHNIGRRY